MNNNKTITLRLTAEDYEALKQIAEYRGTSVGVLSRMLIKTFLHNEEIKNE